MHLANTTTCFSLFASTSVGSRAQVMFAYIMTWFFKDRDNWLYRIVSPYQFLGSTLFAGETATSQPGWKGVKHCWKHKMRQTIWPKSSASADPKSQLLDCTCIYIYIYTVYVIYIYIYIIHTYTQYIAAYVGS